MISFTTKVTLKDYQNFNVFVFKRRAAYKGLKIISILFILMFLTVVAFTILLSKSFDFTMIGLLFFAIGYLWGFPLLIRYSAKKAYLKNPAIQENISYTINDTLIAMKGATFTSDLAWNKIIKANETDEAIYLFQNKVNGIPLPKRDLNQEQILALKNIIHAKKGIKKNLRAK